MPNESLHVAVRQLRKTDIGTVVAVHLAAFPQFFLSSLGAAVLRQFYEGLLEDPYSICIVGETQGSVVGFAAGTGSGGRGFYKRLFLARGIRFFRSLLFASVRNPAVLGSVLKRLKWRSQAKERQDIAELMSLAVDPSRQAHGVGRLLVAEFNKVAFAGGAVDVVLFTDRVENERTRRFYEAFGFIETSHFVNAEGRAISQYEFRGFLQSKANQAII